MNNSDLSFLTDCSNEQLRLLADVLVFDPKDHKKRYTERLSARASYAVYYPHDMKKLLPEIVDEYQRFRRKYDCQYNTGAWSPVPRDTERCVQNSRYC